jgi:hypothetical protein
MMEDNHKEKYALISVNRPKRANQVLHCITDWNFHQLSDTKTIQLTPHPGNEDIITFGKTSDTMFNHYIYKKIMEEQERSLRGESSTYREWSSKPSQPHGCNTLKGLQNNISDSCFKPSEPKQKQQQAAEEESEKQAKGNPKCNLASYDTESDDNEFMCDSNVSATAGEGSPNTQEPVAPPLTQPTAREQVAATEEEDDEDIDSEFGCKPVESVIEDKLEDSSPNVGASSNAQEPPNSVPPAFNTEIPSVNAKQVAFFNIDEVMELSKSAVKAKDEVCKSKDNVCKSKDEVCKSKEEVTKAVVRERDQYMALFTEYKTELLAARKEIERIRSLKEVADAQIQELKDRYTTATGKAFKPAPKKRRV